MLDKFHTSWQRLPRRVEERALKYAALHGASFIFCGHTHQVDHQIKNNIEYWNCGHWTGNTGTFITMNEKLLESKEYTVI